MTRPSKRAAATILAAALLCALLLPGGAPAKRVEVELTGTFTEVAPSTPDGGLHGMELLIVGVPGGYQAVLQIFDGRPRRLMLAPLQYVHGPRLTCYFTDEKGDQWTLLAEVAEDRLVAELRAGNEQKGGTHVLYRGTGSIWDN